MRLSFQTLSEFRYRVRSALADPNANAEKMRSGFLATKENQKSKFLAFQRLPKVIAT